MGAPLEEHELDLRKRLIRVRYDYVLVFLTALFGFGVVVYGFLLGSWETIGCSLFGIWLTWEAERIAITDTRLFEGFLKRTMNINKLLGGGGE